VAGKSLSGADLAAVLGVTTRTLRYWHTAGSGPPRTVENLQPTYRLESLIPWLKKHRPSVKLGAAARESDAAGRLVLLQQWESVLCQKYALTDVEMLYEALRQANFHSGCGVVKVADPPRFWTPGAFAAFSGVIVEHRLSPEQLRALLADFNGRVSLGIAAARDMTEAEFAEQASEALNEQAFEELAGDGPMLRQERNHCADAFRYMVCVADDYLFPVANLPGLLTAAQLVQMNDFLEYVSSRCLIPACKQVRQACQRQIDDLQRSRAGEQMAG
jgi:hypothetical protein